MYVYSLSLAFKCQIVKVLTNIQCNQDFIFHFVEKKDFVLFKTVDRCVSEIAV